eukprot:scaffold13908_cov106-Isochrysis_galbana.AAC.7
MGSSCTRTFGGCRVSARLWTSHAAPSSDDLSSGQPYFRQVVWTSAAVYVSGIERPESQITLGSPASTHPAYWACRRRWNTIHEPSILSVAGIRAQPVELRRHGNLAKERLFERRKRSAHARVENLPPLQLLHKHHEDGREAVRLERLPQLAQVKRLGKLAVKVRRDRRDIVLARDAAAAGGSPRLQVEQVMPQLLGRVGKVVDLGVGV